MNQRDRLLLMVLLGIAVQDKLCDHCGADKAAALYKVIEEAADYLLKNGVRVTPYKVGDTVYQMDGERVYKREISDIVYDAQETVFNEEDFGKTIFPTKAEAEQALKELAEPSEQERRYCFACGGKDTMVGSRAKINGHFHGKCEQCGAIHME